LDPTPIPDQPLEFNVNLWSSESTEFAGPFDDRMLPAVLEVASLEARCAFPEERAGDTWQAGRHEGI
jgi:hypothetical protein